MRVDQRHADGLGWAPADDLGDLRQGQSSVDHRGNGGVPDVVEAALDAAVFLRLIPRRLDAPNGLGRVQVVVDGCQLAEVMA